MNDVYLLTGGNIGNRVANLQHASHLIEQFAGAIIAKSSLYETAPWGITDQPAFLNQVVKCHTLLSARQLLNQIFAAEEMMGRKRALRYGPRIIDIDILLYNNQVIAEADLSIPHPEMANRRFVLAPLNEIAPHLIHPVLNKPVHVLLKECNDQLAVYPYNPG